MKKQKSNIEKEFIGVYVPLEVTKVIRRLAKKDGRTLSSYLNLFYKSIAEDNYDKIDWSNTNPVKQVHKRKRDNNLCPVEQFEPVKLVKNEVLQAELQQL